MVKATSKHSSAAIKQFGYNLTARTLQVEFNSGDKGEYLAVGPLAYLRFRTAFSKGRHLNKVIKPKHTYRNNLGK